MTDEEKAELAIGLIERLAPAIPAFVKAMRESGGWSEGKTVAQSKIDRASGVLNSILDAEMFEQGPDPEWWRDYFLLTGEHMVCGEYGWMPASHNTREVTGEDPEEIFDEVNAPVPA
jgi:hypothetical protein